MRILLIDNHDSFTFNLHQLIAQVAGDEPEVVANDAAAWPTLEAAGFDAVVISPGPGRPQRPADMGLSREAILHAQVPLLGVCLGHQGICHAYGAGVVRLPEPRHGRLDLVHHAGVGLFDGIPSPFTAVRYHSLHTVDLPPELEALAHTDDHVVMAVRHRTRPLYGVQFHPESVGTEHGARLVANFLRTVRPRTARLHAASAPGRAADAAGRAADAPGRATHAAGERPAHEGDRSDRGLTVRWRRLALACDPEQVFLRRYAASPRAFWLDSAAGGRFSIMGDDHGPLAHVLRYHVAGRRLVEDGPDGRRVERGDVFTLLDARLRERRVPAEAALPLPFNGGYVGYLGYECKALSGGAAAHRSSLPDAQLLFADRSVVFDHAAGHVYLLAVTDDAHAAAAERWLAETADDLAAIASDGPAPALALPPPGQLAALGERERRLARPRHDEAAYRGMVAACLEQIRDGETYEVCLTNELRLAEPVEPLPTYRLLRRISPAPFGAFLRLDALAVLSASPERFLRVLPEGVVESQPMKGTMARGADAAEDARRRHELATSAKDRSENLMVVDLVRHDLSRVSRVGSVQVPVLFGVETYATVHQMVSTVRGRLRPGARALDALRAAFPGGSMTGAPKVRTMALLDRLEQGPRGVYSGALGYLSLSGTADFSMVIRTLVCARSGTTLGVGGAIVALSEPSAEIAEVGLKATATLRAVAAARADAPLSTRPLASLRRR